MWAKKGHQAAAGLTWKEAEEAADGLFSMGRTELGFNDLANHFQDVLAAPYARRRARCVAGWAQCTANKVQLPRLSPLLAAASISFTH